MTDRKPLRLEPIDLAAHRRGAVPRGDGEITHRNLAGLGEEREKMGLAEVHVVRTDPLGYGSPDHVGRSQHRNQLIYSEFVHYEFVLSDFG